MKNIFLDTVSDQLMFPTWVIWKNQIKSRSLFEKKEIYQSIALQNQDIYNKIFSNNSYPFSVLISSPTKSKNSTFIVKNRNPTWYTLQV